VNLVLRLAGPGDMSHGGGPRDVNRLAKSVEPHCRATVSN
jgi:hypothetical protein